MAVYEFVVNLSLLSEASRLLREVESWTDDEIQELPEMYQEKAREFRRLANPGEG